ncbi:MAG: uracil-DNA glycosylase family protein [Candidatus Aminicenantales bacterium]
MKSTCKLFVAADKKVVKKRIKLLKEIYRGRKPKADEIKACRPYLERQIKLVDPKTIVLMGEVAQKSVPKELLKGRRVIRTYHPAAGMRFPKIRKKMIADFKRIK